MKNNLRKIDGDIMPTRGDFLIYSGADGELKLAVRLQDETVWLSINQMADLFGVDKSGISRHLKNIFESAELSKEATVAKFATVQNEGDRQVTRELEYYNLDAIISVGYRVNSIRGTQFRIWATQKLTEFIKKGLLLDDERLKEPEGGRYFEELLARIRDIRSSEKIFWRKVLDIYATSADYDPKADESSTFFKQVQNKMHWAAHGHTAAELIFERVDADKPNMGITNFPGNKLLKRDVEIAKNYLNEEELNLLNRIVTAHLEVAEIQALNKIPMTMKDWLKQLHAFLTMTGRELLTHAGKISHDVAMKKAHTEYERFRTAQLVAPTEVERHFVDAEQELTQIQQSRKTHIK